MSRSAEQFFALLNIRPLTPAEAAAQQQRQRSAKADYLRQRKIVIEELQALAALPGAESICETAQKNLSLALKQADLELFQTALNMLELIKDDVRAAANDLRPLTPEAAAVELKAKRNYQRRRNKVIEELRALADLPGAELFHEAAQDKFARALKQAELNKYQTAFETLEPIKHDVRAAIKSHRPPTPEEAAQEAQRQLKAREKLQRRLQKVGQELQALARLPGAESIYQTAMAKYALALKQAELKKYQTAYEMLEPIKHDVRAAIKHVRGAIAAAQAELNQANDSVNERAKSLPTGEKAAFKERASAILADVPKGAAPGKLLEAAVALRGLAAGAPTPAQPAPAARKTYSERVAEIRPDFKKAQLLPEYKANVEGLFAKAREHARNADEVSAHQTLDELEKLIRRALAQGARPAPRRLVEQADRFEALRGTVGAVKKNYLPDGMAANYAAEPLGADEEFNLFLTQLRTFEKERTLKALELVEVSAKVCLKQLAAAHTGVFSRKKTTKENERKKNICKSTLKALAHWRLALEFEQLGPPPWDEVQESRAANLYANVLFEEGTVSPKSADEARNPGAKQGKPLGQSGGAEEAGAKKGVNALWVLDATSWGDRPEQVKQTHAFVFKPMDAESESPGWPRGGSAAREVLGKAIGNHLEALIGLDLRVPETSLVTIDNDKLQQEQRSEFDDAPPQQRVGSLQAWAKSEGSLGALAKKSPGFLQSIPREECQQMGVLDLLSLNLDRHEDNFLVRTEPDSAGGTRPRLLPIDHGQILPSREGLSQNRSKLGYPFAVLAQLPGSNEPFSDEMLDKLENLDPEAIGAGLTQSLAALARRNPEAARNSQIGEENVRLVKRSTRFLKQAAAAGLTLSEIYDAYGEDLEKIFDCAEAEVDQRFAEAIEGSRRRSGTRKRFAAAFDLSAEGTLDRIETQLAELGWPIKGQDLQTFCIRNPDLIVEICQRSRPNPALVQELNRMTAALGDSAPRQGRSTLAGYFENVKTAYESFRLRQVGVEKISAASRMDMQEYLAGDGDELLREHGLTDLRYPENIKEFRRLRGRKLLGNQDRDAVLASLRRAFLDEKLDTAEQVEKLLPQWLEYQQLGGNDTFFRLGGRIDAAPLSTRLESLRYLSKYRKTFQDFPPAAPPPSAGAAPPPPPPVPPPVVLPAATLELANWNEARRLALTNPAPGKLHTDNYRPVQKALTTLQKTKAATEAPGADARMVEEYVKALQELRRVLAGYVLRTAAGDPHAGMAKYARELVVVVDQAISFREMQLR